MQLKEHHISLGRANPTQRRKMNEQGQSTIEFIFTFVFTLAIVFLFAAQGYNFATGYLVHYATFMSSRSYLTADAMGGSVNEENETSAETTFNRYKLNLLDIPASSFKIRKYTQDRSQSGNGMYVGAYTVFERPFSYLGLIGGDTKIKLMSESYLGKEPTRLGCWMRTCQAIVGATAQGCEQGEVSLDITVDDNGC
jgi:hypothetical protein